MHRICIYDAAAAGLAWLGLCFVCMRCSESRVQASNTMNNVHNEYIYHLLSFSICIGIATAKMERMAHFSKPSETRRTMIKPYRIPLHRIAASVCVPLAQISGGHSLALQLLLVRSKNERNENDDENTLKA